ncbi:RNA polymerase sigma-54 factor rpoN [Granulibacter bethesdensis CGDNIH1]|uniref:RNA polymerase sigma-54 factor n=2 Tax=Granulibacter bethesdensis TaxID=364410 RepID=Q0BUA8_GRABC|nr:RNA polymerase sigma-54 factor rpoN [Granulibacter bethesdensis CGDNIH1]APH51396.1 RNA polymerase sigma-54 factor rpoN [Granulibacter bethesdensis]APH64089.1 RNA polymerase sigma-54 factor rpoN [Granulibacter bethesdensis]
MISFCSGKGIRRMALGSAYGTGIGPRLDLRQSQSLVMTPQLRQAIKLLQFNNMEVAAFIEEELERNPLLERDESTELIQERPAPDQTGPEPDFLDSADAASSDHMISEAGPLDVDPGSLYDEPGETASFLSSQPTGNHANSFDNSPFDVISQRLEYRPSLREQLAEQLRLCFASPQDRLIGAHLIAQLDAAGRLTMPPAAIAKALNCPLPHLENIRTAMRYFDPPGLFCLDLKECLTTQLQAFNRYDPAMAILLEHLDLLAQRNHRRLMSLCGVDAEDLAGMIDDIKRCNPKPGAGFDSDLPQTIIPDVLMSRRPATAHNEDDDPLSSPLLLDVAIAGEWLIELNPETMPRVLVNMGGLTRFARRSMSRDDRSFIKEKLNTAHWLVKSLQQRSQTILRVSAEIVRQQQAFFRHGVSHLKPLILRDIAEAVDMHESTISRVTANKYIATPRGTLELKYFFTTAISGADGENFSAEAIRHRIRTLIDQEPASDVLSDDALVTHLKQEGIDIARRTVAKYREALRIPSSVQRKREKAILA